MQMPSCDSVTRKVQAIELNGFYFYFFLLPAASKTLSTQEIMTKKSSLSKRFLNFRTKRKFNTPAQLALSSTFGLPSAIQGKYRRRCRESSLLPPLPSHSPRCVEQRAKIEWKICGGCAFGVPVCTVVFLLTQFLFLLLHKLLLVLSRKQLIALTLLVIAA